MKLLLDENLSRRLIPGLEVAYPGSSQVSLLGLSAATDHDIWKFAHQGGYAIVTQDADFHEQSLMAADPPLVIWLRCGNQPKNVILEKLLTHRSQIEQANQDKDIWCIELY